MVDFCYVGDFVVCVDLFEYVEVSLFIGMFVEYDVVYWVIVDFFLMGFGKIGEFEVR